MKLIKILAEEFPMFNQFDDESGLGGNDMQADSDLSSAGLDSIDGDPEGEGKDDCVCQCDCPCCSAKKNGEDDDSVDDGQSLDFSAQQTGANLENPTGTADDDNEFTFNF